MGGCGGLGLLAQTFSKSCCECRREILNTLIYIYMYVYAWRIYTFSLCMYTFYILHKKKKILKGTFSSFLFGSGTSRHFKAAFIYVNSYTNTNMRTPIGTWMVQYYYYPILRLTHMSWTSAKLILLKIGHDKARFYF